MIYSDTLTVTRYATVQTVDATGRPSADAGSSTFTIRASVQRPDARTLQKIEEGLRTEDAWYVDTITALRSADERTGLPGDTLDIDGETFEVFKVTRVRAVIPHYECLVRRRGEGAP